MPSAADAILARMLAAGDSPAAALARLVAEDGPAPVVQWDDALPRRERSPFLKRLLGMRGQQAAPVMTKRAVAPTGPPPMGKPRAEA